MSTEYSNVDEETQVVVAEAAEVGEGDEDEGPIVRRQIQVPHDYNFFNRVNALKVMTSHNCLW